MKKLVRSFGAICLGLGLALAPVAVVSAKAGALVKL